jgi:hypothetical protein
MQRRYDKVHASYYFQINGIKALKKWMKKIGFTNPNQVTKIKVWNKFGFLPPKTNIQDRMRMLRKNINLGSIRRDPKFGISASEPSRYSVRTPTF